MGQFDCVRGRFDNESAETKQKKKPQFPAALSLDLVYQPHSLASCGLRDLAWSSSFDCGLTEDSFRGFFFIPVLAQRHSAKAPTGIFRSDAEAAWLQVAFDL